jgi:hypothetical protein
MSLPAGDLDATYCHRELESSYEAWLDLSVDHVVPRYLVRVAGFPSEWIEDLLNLVTCCRGCNEFLNGYRVSVEVPPNLAAFLVLRDTVLADKRSRAAKRHDAERHRFDLWQHTLGRVPAQRAAAARDPLVSKNLPADFR